MKDGFKVWDTDTHVRPTLEVTLTQPPSYLRKKKDPETGLALIDIEGSR